MTDDDAEGSPSEQLATLLATAGARVTFDRGRNNRHPTLGKYGNGQKPDSTGLSRVPTRGEVERRLLV